LKVAVSKSKRNKYFQEPLLKLVYEDRYLVVGGEECRCAVDGGRSQFSNCEDYIDAISADEAEVPGHVVHRLDRDTSGTDDLSQRQTEELALEADWHKTVYDRRYVAVLSGEMAENEGTITNWLKDNKAYITYSSDVDNGGKYAVTHFHVLDRSAEHSLVEFQLETGRKNQIRVHASDMGHPVCGDMKYGNGDDPLGRLCLHAYVLCFYHPVTHAKMEFETLIPQTFRSLF
jgi:23S rRNA pseudouridine1911/1915/1917 synthase